MVTYVRGDREEKVLTCISNVKHLHAVPSRLEVLGASCKNTKKSLEDLLIVWRFLLTVCKVLYTYFKQ
jgi:hypothetical protein